MAGFVGESTAQSETAQIWIENSTTVLPVIFFAITIVALYKYPLDKRAYNELLESEKNQSL